jgi:hydrogenase maturation protein HypF
MQRLHIDIQGRVQGIGMRPLLAQQAKQLDLTGWIKNTAQGVSLEIQGNNTQRFLQRLQSAPPTLARIDHLNAKPIPLVKSEKHFNIIHSEAGSNNTHLMPDIGICSSCVQELFDPNSRFYLYPLLNCAQCGPRYSIAHSLPYDRINTSMMSFPLCAACQQEYHDPHSRRYHAEPIACHQCGPQLSHALAEVAAVIHEGKVVAIKNTGGYQLICDAYNLETLQHLRQFKQRDTKPLAVMLENIQQIQSHAHLQTTERQLLLSWQRPIVLLRKKAESTLPELIAPKINHWGMMLPNSAIHYLLFYYLAKINMATNALIVTSANHQDAPLIIDDQRARQQLTAVADLVVSHPREIVARVDDSVVRSLQKKTLFIRRARGFVPDVIPLIEDTPPILALGAQLKNTICVTRGREAFLSPHLGNMDNPAGIDFLHTTIQQLLAYTQVTPEYVAHDLHPDFYTSQLATEFAQPHFPIQHHHAHAAAVVAEQQITTPCLALIVDGYGYGTHAAHWGGELFLYHSTQIQHLGNLSPLAMPGGEKAAKQPWRMGISALYQLGLRDIAKTHYSQFNLSSQIIGLLHNTRYCPPTSSCGRLFDAASSLLGVCHVNQYEGQAAMQLESLVTTPCVLEDGWRIEPTGLNLLPTLQHLLHCDPISGSNLFHGTLAHALAQWVAHHAEHYQVKQIVFSGGCIVNKVLSECFIEACQALGINVFFPKSIPPNDGGISLGQAWLTHQQLQREITCA